MVLERLTKRVIPGFRPVRSLLDEVGSSLLSATDLASLVALNLTEVLAVDLLIKHCITDISPGPQ